MTQTGNCATEVTECVRFSGMIGMELQITLKLVDFRLQFCVITFSCGYVLL